MLPRILAIISVFLIVTKTSEGRPAVATARQFLPALPGYVPVYIRTGDTPLEDINPDLAEAFNSYSLKHGRKAFSRSNNAITDKLDDVEDNNMQSDETKNKDFNVKFPGETIHTVEVVYSGSDHIQKIPRA